jgi:hypothetical protein
MVIYTFCVNLLTKEEEEEEEQGGIILCLAVK